MQNMIKNKTRVIFPLYIYPGEAWICLVSLRKAYPNVPFIAIINPSSGSGDSKNDDYVKYVEI